jgi:NAD(P) transhydrogenase subunit beta
LFVVGLKMLNHAGSARAGNVVSGVGMLIAIVATCLLAGMEFHWILIGCLIGAVIGAVASYAVKMTAMPEMVGLFNGFGGLASVLVAWAEFHKWQVMGWAGPEGYYATLGAGAPDSMAVHRLRHRLHGPRGAMTFSGSMVAYLKLAEKITGKPILFKGQQVVNSLIIAIALAALAFICVQPQGDKAYRFSAR